MNRSERRKLKKDNKINFLSKLINSTKYDTYEYLLEGEKVKLKYDYITSRTGYITKTKEYKKFIEDNKDKVFTVEYDANHLDNPIIVALKEDDSEPKWLFWDEFLERVNVDEDKDKTE